MSGSGLQNDCFALPPGVAWTPVDEALGRLRAGLAPVTGGERIALHGSAGRVLAEPVIARRSNPPYANAAVDGYGFSLAALRAGQSMALPLVPGRAAAGVPFDGTVPVGEAIRILTGAMLPAGVDTVVLEEDVTRDGDLIRFGAGLKPGANTRRAGEDVSQGTVVLEPGHLLRSQDLALAAALGVDHVRVRRRLRVGVLSTGDELVPAGAAPLAHQMFDANRPMLSAMLQRWGYDVVDLGQAADTAQDVEARLAVGREQADAVITTGGASAGDEDHISAVLGAAGVLNTWRIAIKPGRPLALASWDGVPIFGLPGNPVAAFVCALIFARPALSVLQGAHWQVPLAMTVGAAFSKSKKAGRREFLRARLIPTGEAEVFRSEGSGRISGLAWADGLVELPDEAVSVTPGTPVRYLPFSGMGV